MSEPTPPLGPEDRPNRVPWPPVLDFATLLVAYALERLVPLSAAGVMFGPALRGLGLFGAIVGGTIAISGFFAFRRAGTTVDPTGRATTLEMGGIYRFSRNPMYLGTVIFMVGLALALSSSWLLILTPVLAVLLTKLAIEREEAYLERRFGQAYVNYKARVRRWL